MKSIFLILTICVMSCSNSNKNNDVKTMAKLIPITTSSSQAREQFIEARRLVQNGLNSNPLEQFEKAILLDSTFVRMHNFISMYSPDDSVKSMSHELAKKYKHLVSKEEQVLVEATEFRFNNPADKNETLLFELAKRCDGDKYLYHTISYLLFRKNPKLAIKAGLKSVEIDSDYASGYNILGYAYINNKEFLNAENAFDNYIKHAPKRANPYDSKADLLMELGRYEEALVLKKKAYSLDDSFDWIPKEILEIESKIDALNKK